MVTDYKETEIGIIPSDWLLEKLRVVAEFASGSTPSREFQQRYFTNGTIFWVKTMDLNNSEILVTGEKVTEIALKETSSLKIFPPNTVLVAMYGGFNQIGRTGILKINACVNQALTAVFVNEDLLDSNFLINYFNYRVEYWKGVASSSRKDPNITSKDIKDFPIVIPSITEQKEISKVLEDVEKLIFKSENLILKKTNIKQGIMNKLFKPTHEWNSKPLGELTYLIPSGIYGKEFYQTNLTPQKVATTAHIDEDDRWNQKSMNTRYFSPEEVNKFQTRKGDLIIVKSSGSAEKIQSGKIGYISESIESKFLFSNFLLLLRPHGILSKYLYYYLTSYNVKSLLPTLVEASTYPNLRLNDYLALNIPFPNDKEQIQITNTLTDIDLELDTLKKKVLKYKMIKQGMMQSLLTGKIRLV